ncbi:MAG: hypothetical protein KL787_06010 [Taibaiella sp.]|nr:hypothetical protein [Taibaiella sp.]
MSFTVFRDEGADVYGSFLIKVEVMDTSGRIYLTQDMDDLSSLHPGQIKNDYIARIEPGKHSLILPLGARARLTFPISGDTGDPGSFINRKANGYQRDDMDCSSKEVIGIPYCYHKVATFKVAAFLF